MTRKHSGHPLGRLLEYGHQYRVQIWQAIACSILNKLFDLAPPALIGAAVDVVVNEETSFIAQFGVTDVLGQLLILSGLTFIVWVMESVFQYAYDRL
jgi:ATP-binding cassette subfamily B protein